MNKNLAVQVIQAFLDSGGREICVCPGSRNAPLVALLAANFSIKVYYFYEERSAAFFALGCSRRTERPVAVVTTSGTAAVELMPAITEAYYTGVPLVAITADRPRSYRGTNAPQSCEQVGLYGIYAPWSADLEGEELLDISSWDKKGPAHLNVCFKEPLQCAYQGDELVIKKEKGCPHMPSKDLSRLSHFLAHVQRPLVLVGSLEAGVRDAVRAFLTRLGAPVYAEGTSGLREDAALSPMRVYQPTGLWHRAEKAGYPVDGILRIGGIPTARLWRDLEELEGKIQVCSVSDRPFSGLSWGDVIFSPLGALENYCPRAFDSALSLNWKKVDGAYQKTVERLCKEEPCAEVSLMHELAVRLPKDAFIYLGNSLPIRNWDLAAPYVDKNFDVRATRGLSGIDGQVSTFLGLCRSDKSNWAILGDLTTLYDMAGFWVASQLKQISFTLFIVNNGGGQIFSRMYRQPEFINAHSIKFKALADLWGLDYERWEHIPENLPLGGKRIVELVADPEAYQSFWQKLTS